MQVDFIIIGAQKSGTSSLANYLSQHPQICFCNHKEPQYFSRNEHWRTNLQKYHKLFEPKAGQLCGEASTTYTMLPEYQGTHLRLFEYNQESKLIYIMRQPVERIVSHYAHRIIDGSVKKFPELEVIENPIYINRSRYAVQIKPYLEIFPRSNILLLVFEEFVSDPFKTLNQIASFLDISEKKVANIDLTPHNISVKKRSLRKSLGIPFLYRHFRNKAPTPLQPILRKIAHKYLFNKGIQTKPVFSPSFKMAIWRFLEDDVHNIETLLGRRLDIWRNGYK